MMEQILERENLLRAWQRVKSNAGSAGMDGMSIEAFPSFSREHWPRIHVVSVDSDIPPETRVGIASNITARLYLGELTPADVRVELYHGALDANGEILGPKILEMQSEPAGNPEPGDPGTYTFAGHVSFVTSGRHGYTVRVMPNHPDQVNPFETGLILWGQA